MHFAVPDGKPAGNTDMITMKPGARRIIVLFLLTIATAVSFHNFLNLPPVMGMLTGLGYLQVFGYILKRFEQKQLIVISNDSNDDGNLGDIVPFDIFKRIARAEWDTLLFFYGVVMCVGGLGFIGYLGMASELMYTQWGATNANIVVGILFINRRQHTGDVCRAHHEPGHVYRPVAAGHTHRRRRRQPAVDRICSRRCTDGPVARQVYLLRTFTLDTGNCFRLYSQHHGSHVDQHRVFLRTACT